jgi:hypothetical protein
MHDGMEARIWAEHGHAFATSVAGLIAAAGAAFRTLHRIQFDAPWERDAKQGPGQA